jgi:hypothetical protein
MSDTFHFSGDFRGAILNIKSTLRDVQQSVGNIPTTDEETRQELQQLIEALTLALENIPPEKDEDAQAVAETAKVLVETATVEKPNKTMIKITGESLKRAAQNVAEVAPTVIGIASQIVMAVIKITGRQ